MRIKLNGSHHKHDFYEALDTLTLTTWFIHEEHVPGTTTLSINHRSISQPSPKIRKKWLADKNVVLGPIWSNLAYVEEVILFILMIEG